MLALEIKGLCKTYKNGVEALKDINLAVEESDFFALLGPNGAGKSTSIGVITSLVQKTKGTVKIFGNDIDDDFGAVKSKIGVVPQEFNFNIFRSVEDIVVSQAGYYGIAYREAKKRTDKYLSLLGLSHKRNDRAQSLSGGMKRRLMIARAMVNEPKMLILDEPTAGVDIEIRRSMWEFMKQLNESGVTIILTTHYLEEAENLCRNVAIINHGRVVESSGLPALLRQLDAERFILYLDQPISETPQLTSYDLISVDQCTLDAEIPKDGSVTELLTLLAAQGIKVKSMRNKSNRLEELFLRMTGKDEVS